ncbi:MAG: site-specific integrase [Bacteroidetes bacterium]|nr:MAG: site-specific integrase [Bacteroidota bacterium]
MSIVITKNVSRNRKKTWYTLEWGKAAGQRIATGIFTYNNPKDLIEKNHNKESLAILKTKQAHMILENQAIGSGYIPKHKLKTNFLEYYEEYVKTNSRTGSRHLLCSLAYFKEFMNKDYVAPIEITETVCERFRSYLLQKLNGETPADYFYKFKKVLKAAKADGYFINSPAEMIKAKVKPNKKKKELLEPDEYIQLIKTPCTNYEVKKAFVCSLYQGLRWCDVKPLEWESIRIESIMVTQEKTKVLVEIPLHNITKLIIGKPKTGLVFHLPSSNAANKILKKWCEDAGLEKHITWHCARLSFSVLLQDEGVNSATVAGMLGHTSTKYVETVYQRYRVHIGRKAIQKLPSTELN